MLPYSRDNIKVTLLLKPGGDYLLFLSIFFVRQGKHLYRHLGNMREKGNMPPNKNLTFQFEENALGAVFDVQNITSKNSSLTHVKDTIHDTCNVDSHDGNFARAAKDIQV